MKYLKKTLLYCIGLLFIAFGVTFSIKSQLGISPVNSIPYILSLVTGIEQGYLVMVIFGLFILFQVVLLRKNFKIINVLQICFAVIFGYFVNFTNAIVTFDSPDFYILRLLLMGISVVFIAIGVMLYLKADMVPMPAEGLIMAIQQITGRTFHSLKIFFDSAMVSTAILISVLALGGLMGIREGTIIAAIFVGKVIGIIEKTFKPQIQTLKAFIDS